MSLSDIYKAWKLKKILEKLLGDKATMDKLKSRKFILVIVTAVLTAINSAAGSPVPDAMMQWIIGLIGGWVGVQGIVDAATVMKQPTVTVSGEVGAQKAAAVAQAVVEKKVG